MSWQGEVYSLSRALDVKKRDIQKRLGSPADLPSVDETNANIMKDLRGVWDWLNGTYRKTRKLNEAEAKQCAQRDRTEKEHLIQKHLKERQRLQQQFKRLRHNQKQEHDRLKEGFAQYLMQEKPNNLKTRFNDQAKQDISRQNQEPRRPSPGNDMEPGL